MERLIKIETAFDSILLAFETNESRSTSVTGDNDITDCETTKKLIDTRDEWSLLRSFLPLSPLFTAARQRDRDITFNNFLFALLASLDPVYLD